MKNSKRELWVDYIKALACILVVLGHFFQSLVKAGILPDNEIYSWFITTIYYFHVPLFFISSGYLYRKYTKIGSFKDWLIIIRNKFIILGVPYFFFSILSWLFKTLLSHSVNSVPDNIAVTLFVHPLSPYWYLYILFFCFLITPISKRELIILPTILIGVVAKFIYIVFGSELLGGMYLAEKLFGNYIWFALGILIATIGTQKLHRRLIGGILVCLFLIASCLTYSYENRLVAFLMGILACSGFILFFIPAKEFKPLSQFSTYTLPIFLMHTLFAAPIRILIVKLGCYNKLIHIVLGLSASICGPILAMIIMKKTQTDFLVNPKRIIVAHKNTNRKTNNENSNG